MDELNPFDDMTLEAYDGMELLPEPDRSVELNVIMDNLGDGANYAFFNNITYTLPKVPTLYTALSAGEMANDPRVYGEYTHPFVLKKNEIVQIVVNNLDTGRHPFHLHGHNFQAIYRSNESAGTFADEGGETDKTFPRVPMRRDTMVIWPEGNMVLRFKANNPGVFDSHNPPKLIHVNQTSRSLVVPLPHRMARHFRPHRNLCGSAHRAAKDALHPAHSPPGVPKGQCCH